MNVLKGGNMPIKIETIESKVITTNVTRICDKCGFVDKFFRSSCVNPTRDGEPWICEKCETKDNIELKKEKYKKLIGAKVIDFTQDRYGPLDSIQIETKDGVKVLIELGDGFITGEGFDD